MRLRRSKPCSGITLIELLVTLAVIAILLTLGVGGFRTLIANAKITNAANSLIGHLQYARSEALKRNTRVKLCPSTDGTTCISTNPSLWHNGYLVAVVDDAGNLVTPVLRRVDADEMRGVTVSSCGRRSFVYQGNGSAQGSEGTLRVYDPVDPSRIRQVVLYGTGRAYVKCNEPQLYTCSAACP